MSHLSHCERVDVSVCFISVSLSAFSSCTQKKNLLTVVCSPHSFIYRASLSRPHFAYIQIDKVIQLYETMLTRHCTMIVGPTGGGKSVVLSTLVKAQTSMGKPTRCITLNPKVSIYFNFFAFFQTVEYFSLLKHTHASTARR